MIARSDPATNDTGPPLRRAGTVVRVIRPRDTSMRTTSSSARPKSSQPPVVASSGPATVVTDTAGADDLAASGVADRSGAERDVGVGRPVGGAEGSPPSRLATA